MVGPGVLVSVGLLLPLGPPTCLNDDFDGEREGWFGLWRGKDIVQWLLRLHDCRCLDE